VRRDADRGRAGGHGGQQRRGGSLSAPALADVADFLRAHPPFDALGEDDVELVAAAAEVEFHAAGTTIIAQGGEPVEHLRVVRSGAVEIVHDGRVLDLLGPGELFGHASMLSGLPAGFAARAHEDTLCYRVPADAARGPLGRPQALEFVTRSLLYGTVAASARERAPGEPSHQPVGSLIRAPLVVCGPEASIRDAARRMTEVGATSVVVDLGGGALGIVTDRDLRTRVVSDGLPYEAPVTQAMTAPAYTVAADRVGDEVLLDMLDRGIRHFPVLAATGEVLGVVADVDIVAVEARTSFALRTAIARASTVDELAAAARELPRMVVALQRARLAPRNIAGVHAVVVDALVRRLVDLELARTGPPPVEFAWLALGSLARREFTPGSDVDSAIAWRGGDGDPNVKAALHAVGVAVDAGLRACGLAADDKGATAADPLFARSIDSWRRAARSWLEDPSQEKALILVSVVVDSRPTWGVGAGMAIADALGPARAHPALLRQLARFSLSYRPPTGFLRGLVVEHSGEHRGRLDLKHGGLVPIVDLARWAGMAAGVTSASTPERLDSAAKAGTLSAADASTLADAFDLVLGLRLEHQVEQLEAGRRPDDHLDPAELSPLARSYLREAFRAVASVQKRVGSELTVGLR
jgi:CBS domain-containing protein